MKLDAKRKDQNIYRNWAHAAHKLMPAEGTVWLQGPSSRRVEGLKIFRCWQTSSDKANKNGPHIQISKRLSCFETDSVLLRARFTYSFALCMFSAIPFVDQNF